MLSLFNLADPEKNRLPYEGIVNYYGVICENADDFYQKLYQDLAWKADEAIIFGKRIQTKRKVAWYGDESFHYTYSGVEKVALPWTKELLELKKLCEEFSHEKFNSCLANLYHDGSEGMAWHSDAEKYLKPEGAIASFTLGAERKFSFKHKKTKEKIDLYLENGSLLIMKGSTQTNWLHRLPPTAKFHQPRINLTFRTIVR